MSEFGGEVREEGVSYFSRFDRSGYGQMQAVRSARYLEIEKSTAALFIAHQLVYGAVAHSGHRQDAMRAVFVVRRAVS